MDTDRTKVGSNSWGSKYLRQEPTWGNKYLQGSSHPKSANNERADETDFDRWYEEQARAHGIDPNPDDPRHQYDYRAAYQDGVRGPNKEGQWPDKYVKKEGYLGIVDTKTGKPRSIPGALATEKATPENLYGADHGILGTTIDNTIAPLARAAVRGQVGLAKSGLGLVQAVEELGPAMAQGAVNLRHAVDRRRDLGMDPEEAPPQIQGELSPGLTKTKELVGRVEEAVAREDQRRFRARLAANPVGTLVEGVTETLPALAAYAGLGVAAPEALPAVLFAQEAGSTYGSTRDLGASPTEAALAGTVGGGVNAALGTLQVGRVLEGLGPNASAAIRERLLYLLKTGILGAGTAEAQAVTRQLAEGFATAEDGERVEAAKKAVTQGLDVDTVLDTIVPGFLASVVAAGGAEITGRKSAPQATEETIPLVHNEDGVVGFEQITGQPEAVVQPEELSPLLETPDQTQVSDQTFVDGPQIDPETSRSLSDDSDTDIFSPEPEILRMARPKVFVEEAPVQSPESTLDTPPESLDTPVRPVPPAWLLEPPTKQGAKLVVRFAKDPQGKLTGARSIVDHLARAVNVEVRIGKTQLKGSQLAHFEPAWRGVRTRTANSLNVMAHEIGHGVENVLRSYATESLPAVQKSLISLTEGPTSYASAKNSTEGFAEWVRRYVTDPGSVANHPATPEIESVLARAHPNILNALQDSARAWEHQRARSVMDQFRSYNQGSRPTQPPLAEGVRDAVDTFLTKAGTRRRGIHRMEESIYRAAKEDVRPQVGRLRADWVGGDIARAEYLQAKGTNRDVESAYQLVNHIPTAIEHALRGTESSRGVRVITDGGNYETLFPRSFEDIKYEVGKDQWDDFVTYGDAKATIPRAKAGHDYPGMESLRISDLERIVSEQEAAHPEWNRLFKDVQGYTRSMLDVLVKGGIKSPQEADVMANQWEDYWPLYRKTEEDAPGLSGANKKEIDALNRRASGSMNAIDSLDANIQKMTEDTFRAYYWNRSVMAPVKFAEQIRNSPTATPLMKVVAERVATRLNPNLEGYRKVADLRPDELQNFVADHENIKNWKEIVGEQLTPESLSKIDPEEFQKRTGLPMLQAGDVDVSYGPGSIYRQKAAKDTAIRVVVAKENGESVPIQIHDPILYDVFTKSREPGELARWYSKVVGKLVKSWKRTLTQNLGFVLNNIPRDAITSMYISPHNPEALLPTLYAASNFTDWLLGKIKSPGDRSNVSSPSETELMSRSIEDHHWSPNANLAERFAAVAKEGIIPEGYAEMSAGEKLAELPGQVFSTLLKPVDLFLYSTGQRALSEASERITRQGAYKKVKAQGGTDQSAQLAHDLSSGNFGESPGDPDMATMYRALGFVNPGLQSSYEGLRLLVHPNPRVRLGAMSRLVVGTTTLATVWATSRLLMSDEEKEMVKERTETDRQNSMYLAGGFKMPYGFGIEGLANRFVINKLDESIGGSPEAEINVPAQVLRQVTSIPGGIADLIPPLPRTLIEYKTGFDFFQDKPYEPGWMSRIPEENRYYDNTPQVYVDAGKTLEESPLRLQKLVRSGISPIYDEAAKGLDVASGRRAIEQPADTPIVGRIFQRTPAGFNSYSAKRVEKLAEPYARLTDRYNEMSEDEQQSPEGVQLEKEMARASQYNSLLNELKRRLKDARRLRGEKSAESRVLARKIELNMTVLANKGLLAIRNGEDPDLSIGEVEEP